MRALYDAWVRKARNIPSKNIEELLKILSENPPSFFLPPASVFFTKSFLDLNKPKRTERGEVYDTFVVVRKDDSVLFIWEKLSLEPDLVACLAALLSSLNYFGRSESWVAARFVGNDAAQSPNCFPADAKQLPAFESIRVACPVPPSKFERNRRAHGLDNLGWLEALIFSTLDVERGINVFKASQAKVTKSGMSDPPAMERVNYLLPKDALIQVPISSPSKTNTDNCVLYALESTALPSITVTVQFSSITRHNLMGSHRRVIGSNVISPKFSGKNADGTFLKDGHSHVYILPIDRDRDGRLDHLIITCSEPFDESERLALDRIAPVFLTGRPPIKLLPIRWGRKEDIKEGAGSTHFTSATPFVPNRYYRKGRGDFSLWLAEELARELAYIGMPRPKSLKFVPHIELADGRHLRWLEFMRSRKDEVPRIGFGLNLIFDEPVNGPFSVGYASHFGLGLFLPSSVL